MILIIDNRDSYTFNLAQLFASVTGRLPLVVPAGDVFLERIPARLAAGEFSHLVISPGPGTPAAHADFAGSRAALEAATHVPALGVCLGHQGLGMLAGAGIDRAPRARHGFVSQVSHSGEGIFRGLPQDFEVVRYHSLHVREPENASLRIHARAEDGVVMGLEVPGRPHWGVQFHPESILTEHGATLVRNFLELRGAHENSTASNDSALRVQSRHGRRATKLPRPRPAIHIETLELAIDCEATFARLQAGVSAAFWLDSASNTGDSGRYSVLGTNAGSLARTIRYRVGGETEVMVGGHTESVAADILDYLDEALATKSERTGDTSVPFADGLFGYLGYECRALTTPTVQAMRFRSEQPDSYWIAPQAHIVVDHQTTKEGLARVHLVVRDGDDADELREQLHGALAEVELPEMALPEVELPEAPLPEAPHEATRPDLATEQRRRKHISNRGKWRLRDAQYASRIADIKSALLRGDSYEVCLTDTFEADARVDGFELYRDVRRHSPAPYAAYFRFDTFGDKLEVICASPERFLRVDRDRTVESKPIKGTAPRASEPGEDAALARELQNDPKTRAENLMIVDLLRNDLGRVAEIGSVSVPKLMAIESYATVHQLVSTVRGELRRDQSLVDVLRATFPGGSMTGAPKARTLEIIDALEAGPRGIYSGTLGFLGRDETADLNIVIRTIVKDGDRLQIGAGGAIVLDSDAAAEIAEKNLKAAALQGAIDRVSERIGGMGGN